MDKLRAKPLSEKELGAIRHFILHDSKIEAYAHAYPV